jgi:hypothetical protein
MAIRLNTSAPTSPRSRSGLSGEKELDMYDNTWRIQAINEMGLTHRMENGFHHIEGVGFKYKHTSLMCAMRRIGHALSDYFHASPTTSQPEPFHLSEDDQKVFAEALINPTEPNEALVKAGKEFMEKNKEVFRGLSHGEANERLSAYREAYEKEGK